MPTIAVWMTTVVMIAVLALVALAGRMERDELE
jgi:amino acid transporter